MAASFKDRVTRAVAWHGSGTVATRVFMAVVTVILARLLSPKDFGVVGMTTLYTGFVAMFTELGLASAVVQAKEVEERLLNSVFWFASAAGCFVWLASAVFAPALAGFFDMPALRSIVPVSSAGFAIGSLGLVPRAMLARRLDFRSIASGEILSALTFGIFAIAAAFAGLGPWALVLGGLAKIGTMTAFSCVRAKWMPGLRVTRHGLRPLIAFGVKTLGVSLAGYMRSNVDYLVIGRFMGAAPLGQYTLAFKLADFPRGRLTPIFTSVAFPAFSSMQDAVDSVRRAYLRGARLVSLVVFPMLVGAALVASELVVVVYGAKWQPAIFPARVLLLMGILLAVGEIATTVLVSTGRPGLQLMMSTGYTIAVAVFVLLALPWGIDGVAIAVCGATLVYFGVLIHFAHGAMEVPLPKYLLALRPALVGCATMAVGLLGLEHLVFAPGGLDDVATLVASIVAGMAFYFVGVGAEGRGELRDVLKSMFGGVLDRIRRRRSAPAPGIPEAETPEA